MLAIRMQRTGRKGQAQFRVLVQDSRQTPTSGKFVAHLGSYNPHTKTTALDKEKAAFYLEHGAQPSDRVVALLKREGVKIPAWVKEPVAKEGKIRNQEKLRKNRAEEPETPTEEAPAAEPEAAPSEAPAEKTSEEPEAPAEAPAEPEAPAAEPEAEKPAEPAES